jgi:hypothetical protein
MLPDGGTCGSIAHRKRLEAFIESEPNEVSVNNRGQTASLPPEAILKRPAW